MQAETPDTRRVLVIDGSPTVTLMVCTLLRHWGFAPSEAKPDAPGLDTLSEKMAGFDLMIAQPVLGNVILERWQLAARRAGVPWLALVSSEAAGRAAGADAWVVKPIRPLALYNAIMLCTDRSSAPKPSLGVDLGAIIALWGGAHGQSFRKVARIFLGESAQRLADMAAAQAEGSRDKMLFEAHSVASAADNVGCAGLAQAARRVEQCAAGASLPELRTLMQAMNACAAQELPSLSRLIGTGENGA